MRYTAADDFGLPETAFLACSFWYIDALAQIGRRDEARELFEGVLAHRNHFGLLSRTFTPNRRALGQFPPGLFDGRDHQCGDATSSSWEEAWLCA